MCKICSIKMLPLRSKCTFVIAFQTKDKKITLKDDCAELNSVLVSNNPRFAEAAKKHRWHIWSSILVADLVPARCHIQSTVIEQ